MSRKNITCKEKLEFFKSSIKMFQGEGLPEPKTIFHATAEANNLVALENAKSLYNKLMEEMCGGDKPYLNPKALRLEHSRCVQRCLDLFHSTHKLGGSTFSQAYEDKLKLDVAEAYNNFAKHNDSRNVFSAARTPTVIFAAVAIAYIISRIFGMCGLEMMANFFIFIMVAFLVLLAAWMHTRYTGKHIKFSLAVDHLADLLLENVLSKVYNGIAEMGLHEVLGRQGSAPSSEIDKKKTA